MHARIYKICLCSLEFETKRTYTPKKYYTVLHNSFWDTQNYHLVTTTRRRAHARELVHCSQAMMMTTTILRRQIFYTRSKQHQQQPIRVRRSIYTDIMLWKTFNMILYTYLCFFFFYLYIPTYTTQRLQRDL